MSSMGTSCPNCRCVITARSMVFCAMGALLPARMACTDTPSMRRAALSARAESGRA
jgi:hypothetical protein